MTGSLGFVRSGTDSFIRNRKLLKNRTKHRFVVEKTDEETYFSISSSPLIHKESCVNTV